jgi:hypothetical protein
MKIAIVIVIVVVVAIVIAIGVSFNTIDTFSDSNNPFNNIDEIYYINLEHRADRNEQVLKEFERMQIPSNKIIRISAIYDKENGYIGCAKSHVIALTKFIESNKETCIIFEDDVEFIEPIESAHKILNDFFNSKIKYDVCALSYNTIESKDTEYPFLKKTINSQATSAMIINKNFAQKLLNNYSEGLALLEKTNDPMYIIDVYFKKLMPESDWYDITPKLGRQRVSHSDIQNKVVEYNA